MFDLVLNCTPVYIPIYLQEFRFLLIAHFEFRYACISLHVYSRNGLLENWSFFTKTPVDTVRKLNVHKTFRRRPGRLLTVFYVRSIYVLCLLWHFKFNYFTKSLAIDVWQGPKYTSGNVIRTKIEAVIRKCRLGLQLYYKETPTQVFSCEICETFKNTFLYRAPLVTASAKSISHQT